MANGKQSALSLKQKILLDLKDTRYRRGFVEGHAKDTIAFQIRMLRKARDWEQRDVAAALGNPKLQPMISRYENPDYGRYSVTTLLELAEVFDVALVVRFAPFSELLEWDWASNETTLCPASFGNDSRLAEIAAKTEAQIAQQQQSLIVRDSPGSLPLGSVFNAQLRETEQEIPPPIMNRYSSAARALGKREAA
jgi:transcriptional regulator with XRE-family HTH domain